MLIELPKLSEGMSVNQNLFDKIATNTSELKNIYIIGANGSGKSRMGIYMEAQIKNAGTKVIRIAAQKVLSIPSETMNRSVEMIDQDLQNNANRSLNLQGGVQNNHVTTITNDFTHILSKLFSLKAKRDSDLVDHIQAQSINGQERVNLVFTLTPIDLIKSVWKDIFPHRDINFNDNRIFVNFYSYHTGGYSYLANDMSDGERGALYLLAHAFTAPAGSVIIFDEPESHLHKVILSRVWDKIEQYTRDKLIITITHDLDLVASRKNCIKIWTKEYHGGTFWDWEIIGDNEEIPESLFLQLLGSRKKIMFVESTEDGNDQAIFREIYSDYTVIPCGSCEKVIQMTKALNSNGFWKAYRSHGVSAVGLIDRDLRSDEDVANLKGDNIEVLEVAEIENLLALPDVIKIICIHQGIADTDYAIKQAEQRVKLHLESIIPSLSFDALKQEISYMYKDLHKEKKDDFINNFNNKFSKQDLSVKVKAIENNYKSLLTSGNLKELLKTFKNKGIIHQMNPIIGGGKYKDLVVRLILSSSKVGQDITAVLKANLPTF